MSERTVKSQVLWPEAAKQSGDLRPWLSGILGAARKQKCHKAIPPMRHCEKIIREPLDKAAEVVAKAVASDAGGSAKGKAVAIPEGKITGASIDEQYELADLVRNWTDKKKDWRMFTAIDDDDEEIGTKMMLLVLRKYMAIGSAPVTDWKAEFNRKQSEDETAMDCWERIKTAATALASADRAMPHALIVDTLKEALSSSHTHWVVDIEDDATFEQIDALIIKKAVYIDQKERGYDSAGKAAYVAADAASESDKDEQIRVLTAAVSSLKSTLMKKNLSAASGSKKFTGNCHYCKQPGHMLNDCEKLKAKRRNDPEAGKRRQDKDTDDFEGAAFSACFVAHYPDSSSAAADDSPSGETWQFVRPKAVIRNKPADKSVCPGGTVAVPVQNSFDILCDSNDSSDDAVDLPAAATPVEGLHSSTEYSSPFSASTYEVGESSGTSAPVAASVPSYFQSPPDLPANSLKHPLV